MSAKANPARDVFTFSLRGAAAINTYAFVPAIADDGLNNAWDRRLSRPRRDRPRATRVIEDFLARYFASGCREPVWSDA